MGESEGELTENFEDIEQEKENKLLNLIVRMLVRITLKELYEAGDQISEI
jgi:hypothetical protein